MLVLLFNMSPLCKGKKKKKRKCLFLPVQLECDNLSHVVVVVLQIRKETMLYAKTAALVNLKTSEDP